MDEIIYSPCGLICNDCAWYKGEAEPKCLGCKTVDGKPFWGTCLTFSCVAEHGVEHCGLCEDFPCDDFMGRYDPREGPSNAVLRAGLLAYRAKHGDEKAIELTRKREKEH
ncbi:MAG: DUF3795 domain-containing protein [Candidatus Bathyarchaeota archaeon]|nr:DUF3795 domain-containing protein [Candidatus Bathyarchaeota archaeon]